MLVSFFRKPSCAILPSLYGKSVLLFRVTEKKEKSKYLTSSILHLATLNRLSNSVFEA